MKLLIAGLLIAILIAISILIFASSQKKGPAEKAGKKLDNAAKDVKDAINPKGPAEKVGEKIDDVLDD